MTWLSYWNVLFYSECHPCTCVPKSPLIMKVVKRKSFPGEYRSGSSESFSLTVNYVQFCLHLSCSFTWIPPLLCCHAIQRSYFHRRYSLSTYWSETYLEYGDWSSALVFLLIFVIVAVVIQSYAGGLKAEWTGFGLVSGWCFSHNRRSILKMVKHWYRNVSLMMSKWFRQQPLSIIPNYWF